MVFFLHYCVLRLFHFQFLKLSINQSEVLDISRYFVSVSQVVFQLPHNVEVLRYGHRLTLSILQTLPIPHCFGPAQHALAFEFFQGAI